MDAHNGDVEWRVCRPVVADSYHFDEDPHQGGKSDPDPQQIEKSDSYEHHNENRDPDPHQRDADPQDWFLKWIYDLLIPDPPLLQKS